MGIVIGSLFGIIIIAGVIWFFALYGATCADRRQRAEAQAAAAEASRLQERDRRMRVEAIQLRCAGCNRVFLGPLTDDGCPECHSGALVIPDADYLRVNAQG